MWTHAGVEEEEAQRKFKPCQTTKVRKGECVQNSAQMVSVATAGGSDDKA